MSDPVPGPVAPASATPPPADDHRPEPPSPEHTHKNVQGGTARAAIFGVSDGLVSNVGLILGVAGAAATDPSLVRVAGLAGLIAGAISMAAGEYNSMTVQRELLERELEIERRELARNPNVEKVELAQIYQSRGFSAEHAHALSESVMSDPELALATHAREELGINPDELGSPLGAAGSSFVAFAAGALVPLVPWFFASGTAAIVTSLVLAGVVAVAVGVITARYTDRSKLLTVGRQLVFTMVPAAITFAIGSAVGVTTT